MNRLWQVVAMCATGAAVAACGPQAATTTSGQHHMDMNMHMNMNAKPAAPVASVGVQRKYYIAADQVLWDYAPDGQNDITGAPFTAEEQVFTKQGPNRVGHKYWKSLYRGYTDATFTHQIARPTSCAPVARACDDSLGMLGPVIRASVGDSIQVVFKNNTPYPASIHPHGVFYQKDSEGAPYSDGTSGADKADALHAVLEGISNDVAAGLAARLRRYVSGSLAGGLFAGPTNVELNRRLVVFDQVKPAPYEYPRRPGLPTKRPL